jgi:hypothetical protein
MAALIFQWVTLVNLTSRFAEAIRTTFKRSQNVSSAKR